MWRADTDLNNELDFSVHTFSRRSTPQHGANAMFMLLVITAASLLSACNHQTADSLPAPTLVRVATVNSGPGAAAIVTTGVIAARDEAKLSFKVGGVIQRIAVHEGEQVKLGQVLAELIPTEINAQLSQAQQLSDKAARDVERGERLYADQVIALSQLEDLRTQAKVVAAQLQAATFNQGYARIIASSAGTVLRKLADEHELVQSGQPVLVLGGRDNGFVVRAALSDRDAVQLHVGDAATVQLDAFPGKQFVGVLSEIGGAARVENGLFPVEVRLQHAPEVLASGLVAQLIIQPQQASAQSLPYVPTGAVVAGIGRQASVFVVEHDVARRRDITVAFFTRDQVAVSDGIKAGEQVVTDGALYLSDGIHVSVQTASTQL